MKKVQVTEDDIRCGERLSSEQCPIALALKRVFPRRLVSVGPYMLNIGLKRYYVTKAMYDFILRFDTEQEVKPFDFDLDSLKEVD